MGLNLNMPDPVAGFRDSFLGMYQFNHNKALELKRIGMERERLNMDRELHTEQLALTREQLKDVQNQTMLLPLTTQNSVGESTTMNVPLNLYDKFKSALDYNLVPRFNYDPKTNSFTIDEVWSKVGEEDPYSDAAKYIHEQYQQGRMTDSEIRKNNSNIALNSAQITAMIKEQNNSNYNQTKADWITAIANLQPGDTEGLTRAYTALSLGNPELKPYYKQHLDAQLASLQNQSIIQSFNAQQQEQNDTRLLNSATRANKDQMKALNKNPNKKTKIIVRGGQMYTLWQDGGKWIYYTGKNNDY